MTAFTDGMVNKFAEMGYTQRDIAAFKHAIDKQAQGFRDVLDAGLNLGTKGVDAAANVAADGWLGRHAMLAGWAWKGGKALFNAGAPKGPEGGINYGKINSMAQSGKLHYDSSKVAEYIEKVELVAELLEKSANVALDKLLPMVDLGDMEQVV